MHRSFSILPRTCLCIAFALAVMSSACSLHAADDDADHSGLGAVPGQLQKLLPLCIHEGRLMLDQDAWKRAQEAETPEQRRAAVAARMAQRLHLPVEKVPPQFIDNMMNNGSNLPAVDVFQGIMEDIGGGASGNSTSQSGHAYSVSSECRLVEGALNINSNSGAFDVKFAEKTGSRRILSVADDKTSGLSIHYANTAKQSGFVFVQAPGGPAVLAAYSGPRTAALSGETFIAMLHKDPKTTLEYFIQPLVDAGVDLPFSRSHPAVMSMAANGFNASSDPEIKQHLDALAKALVDDDQDVREKSQKELLQFFPKAIFEITSLRDAAQDPELKKRLSNAIDAYPEMQLAREFVLLEKLHEDRAYLLDLLRNDKYKAGARARLTSLVGKDYGENPEAWPK